MATGLPPWTWKARPVGSLEVGGKIIANGHGAMAVRIDGVAGPSLDGLVLEAPHGQNMAME